MQFDFFKVFGIMQDVPETKEYLGHLRDKRPSGKVGGEIAAIQILSTLYSTDHSRQSSKQTSLNFYFTDYSFIVIKTNTCKLTKPKSDGLCSAGCAVIANNGVLKKCDGGL